MVSPNSVQLSRETQIAIDFLANHDIKAASYTVLAHEGPLTPMGLVRVVDERIGQKLNCIRDYLPTYHQGGFADFREFEAPNHLIAREYSATPSRVGMAAIGAVLDWSEKHDTAALTALAQTASVSSRRAPVGTITLLDTLIKASSSPSGDAWFTTDAASPRQRLKGMLGQGLVLAREEPPQFRILDPTYNSQKRKRPFEALSQQSQNIYRILNIAQEIDPNPDRQWTIDELEEMALKFRLIGQEDTEARHQFRSKFMRVISIDNPNYARGLTQKVNTRAKAYRIAPHFEEAAADLVERVVKLDTSPATRSEFEERAEIIHASDEQLARIINRGVASSSYINANR